MGRRNRGLRGILCGPRKNISLFWSLFLSLPLSAALSLCFCLSIFLIPCLSGKQQMFSSCYCPCLLFFFFLASLASQNVWGNREIYPKLSRSGGREVCGKWQTCSHHAPHHVSIPFLQNFQEHPVGMCHGQMKTHTHIHTMQPPHPEMKKSIVFCADKKQQQQSHQISDRETHKETPETFFFFCCWSLQ